AARVRRARPAWPDRSRAAGARARGGEAGPAVRPAPLRPDRLLRDGGAGRGGGAGAGDAPPAGILRGAARGRTVSSGGRFAGRTRSPLTCASSRGQGRVVGAGAAAREIHG